MSACRVQEGVSLSYNLHLAREEMPHTHPVLQSEFLKFPFFQAPPRAAPTPRRSPRRKREGKEGGRHADDWQKLRLKSDGRRRGMGGRGSGKQDGTGWGKKTKTELSGPFLLFPRSPPGLISASIRDSAQVGCLHARRSMQVEEKPQRSSSLAEDHNLRRSWREKILKKKYIGLYLAIWTPTSVIAGKNLPGDVKSTRGGDCHGFPWEGQGVPPSLRGGIVRPMVKNSSLDAAKS